MNFTREPIIETVITPREGCKLVVRSSKGVGQEDYFVDAVEVVSFGSSIFYRSTERPKSFLLPVSDYEILELKETRMVLKNAGIERSIKIGGGKEQPPEPKEPLKQKRRTRRRKTTQPPLKEEALPVDETQDQKPNVSPKQENTQVPREKPASKAEGGDTKDETNVSSPLLSKLLPPPPTLIKEKLSKFKDQEILDANIVEEKLKDPLDIPADLENETPQEDVPPPVGLPLSEKEKPSKDDVENHKEEPHHSDEDKQEVKEEKK